MLHPEALVVRRNCTAGDCLQLWVALLGISNELQHVFHFIALCFLVGQTLCSNSEPVNENE